MKTQTILDVIEILNESAKALRMGNTTLEHQMSVGMKCYRAEVQLRAELIADVPNVKVI